MDPIRERQLFLTRRQLFGRAAAGIGTAGLASLLNPRIFAAESKHVAHPALPGFPNFAPKAKRVVQVFCVGGMSHLDTFDYKPKLSERTGKSFDMPTFFGQAGNLMGSLFEFQKRGAMPGRSNRGQTRMSRASATRKKPLAKVSRFRRNRRQAL